MLGLMFFPKPNNLSHSIFTYIYPITRIDPLFPSLFRVFQPYLPIYPYPKELNIPHMPILIPYSSYFPI